MRVGKGLIHSRLYLPFIDIDVTCGTRVPSISRHGCALDRYDLWQNMCASSTFVRGPTEKARKDRIKRIGGGGGVVDLTARCTDMGVGWTVSLSNPIPRD